MLECVQRNHHVSIQITRRSSVFRKRVSLRSVRRFSCMSSIELPLKIGHQISLGESVYYDILLIYPGKKILSCHDLILIHDIMYQEIAHYHRMKVTIQRDEESLGEVFLKDSGSLSTIWYFSSVWHDGYLYIFFIYICILYLIPLCIYDVVSS